MAVALAAVAVLAFAASDGGGCSNDVDCSLNGRCVAGVCRCEAAWKGDSCEVLSLLPADLSKGYDSPHAAKPGKSSSWGGSVVEVDGVFHMYSAEMANDCGIDYWEPNSRVVHATSSDPEGPYVFQSVVVAPFAHEPNAVRGPDGEIVIYLTMRHPAGYSENCTVVPPTPAPTPAPTPVPTPPPTPAPCQPPPTRSTYMTWAKNPYGPWSEPVLVLKPNGSLWGDCPVLVDTNLAVAIRPDGSGIGVWRKCTNTPNGKCKADCCTFPHMLSVGNWKDPASYVPSPHPMFPDLVPYGSEDPFVWLDESVPGGVHVILHDEQGKTRCSAKGIHAFTADNGATWRYGQRFAYNGTVQTVGGGTMQYSRRERPHLILNAQNVPTHVTNGVQEEAASTDCATDPQCYRSYTLAQPLRSTKE